MENVPCDAIQLCVVFRGCDCEYRTMENWIELSRMTNFVSLWAEHACVCVTGGQQGLTVSLNAWTLSLHCDAFEHECIGHGTGAGFFFLSVLVSIQLSIVFFSFCGRTKANVIIYSELCTNLRRLMKIKKLVIAIRWQTFAHDVYAD